MRPAFGIAKRERQDRPAGLDEQRARVIGRLAVRVEDADVKATQTELDSVLEALQRPHSQAEYDELLLRRRWCE